jgi:hypothetical protein
MKKLLKTLLKVFLSLIIALILAFVSAYLMLRKPEASIRNGSWETDLTVGSENAGLYQRARISLYALWALNSSETIYFLARTDSEGNRLNRQCVYRIEGSDPQTRWWSIAAYNNYHLIPNAENRYSFSKTTVEREPDSSWQIRLASEKQARNWLPSGDADGELILALRAYNPAPELARNLTGTPLPKIIKEGCR